MCGKEKYLYPVNSLEQEQQYKIMYRGPGRDSYQTVAEVLDEILTRLDSIEQTLSKLEKPN